MSGSWPGPTPSTGTGEHPDRESLLVRLVLLGFGLLGLGVGWQRGLLQLAVRTAVDSDDAVLAAAGDHLAIGAGRDRVDKVGRAGEVADRAAVVGVPHPDVAVAAAGQKLRRIANEE